MTVSVCTVLFAEYVCVLPLYVNFGFQDVAKREAFADRLNITGSQFFALDESALVRRCGGDLKYVSNRIHCLSPNNLHLFSVAV